MPPGRGFRPITNGLHRDHRGIRRVREDGHVGPLLPLDTVDHIVTTPHLFRTRARACLLVVAVVAGGILAFASNATAAPSTQAAPNVACWKRLLNDWYDGRIDRAYPLRCYREAIANLPEDVKVYADAEADIRRAMLAAVRQSKKDTGKEPTLATPLPPASTPKPPSSPPPPAPSTGGTKAPATPVDPNNPDDGVIAGPETITTGATRSSDTLPLPLLVLGALALLLLAAAGFGVVNKRLQARRVTATPPASEEPPPVV